MGQKPCAEGHFAHVPGGGFDLCLAGLQKEPSARLMEPTGVDGLWGKGECASFTQYFFGVIILLVKRSHLLCPQPTGLAAANQWIRAATEPGPNRAIFLK